MRFLITDVLLPLLVFLLLRSVLRNVFSPASSQHPSGSPQPQPPRVEAGGELKKDPVCGTYVSMTSSLQRRVHGETVYFCSPECRDKYRG